MDASSSLDEFASADEFTSDCDACFSPMGNHSRDAGKLMHKATHSIPERSQPSQDETGAEGSGRDVVSSISSSFQQACRTELLDAGAEADVEYDGSDSGSRNMDALVTKDLDSGDKLQLFKVFAERGRAGAFFVLCSIPLPQTCTSITGPLPLGSEYDLLHVRMHSRCM